MRCSKRYMFLCILSKTQKVYIMQGLDYLLHKTYTPAIPQTTHAHAHTSINTCTRTCMYLSLTHTHTLTHSVTHRYPDKLRVKSDNPECMQN